MAVTGVALSGIPKGPEVAAPTLPGTGAAGGTIRAPGAADRQITVTSVPAVDLIDGTDAAANRPLAIRVAGIRAVPDCWAGEARARALNLLSGKQVWLVTDNIHPARDGRVHAMVLLSDGHDYAYTVVNAGAALADTGPGAAANQGELTAAQAAARRTRTGWWSSTCSAAPAGDSTTSTSAPPTDQVPTTNTPVTPTVTGAPAPPPAMTSSTAPPADDGVQHNVHLGAPCSPPGARGVTTQGQDAVCTAKGNDPAKWKKA